MAQAGARGLPSWETLKQFPKLLQGLEQFSDKEHNSENYKFLLAIEQCRRTSDSQSLNKLINGVISTYIVSNAPSQVNISGAVQQPILRAIAPNGAFDNGALMQLLQPAYEQIVSVLESDVIRRYTGSSTYRQFYQETATQVQQSQDQNYRILFQSLPLPPG